jgi:N-(2-amino-2-carboxyethyl)-L-glutamate synthase
VSAEKGSKQTTGGLADLSPAELAELTGRIGDSPLVPVTFTLGGAARRVHLKMEGNNPAGSVKDRTARALIEDVERRGVLRGDSIIVESSSGNLGVALSFICRARGYRFLAIVDPKTTRENVERMRALGAEVDVVDTPDPSGGYLLTRLERVRSLCVSSARYVWTDQYSNPANVLAHYGSTAPEILRQMNGRVGAVFVAVSTGGTLAGVGKFFHEKSPATRVIGVDARGSVVFEDKAGPRKLTGIGSARKSSFLTQKLYDGYVLVSDAEAFALCRMLFAETGLQVGGSSGAVLAACGRWLDEHRDATDVVCLCADRGENYASTIFDDAWLAAQGFDPKLPGATVVTSIRLAPPPADAVAAPVEMAH